jgi:hypothetical protein
MLNIENENFPLVFGILALTFLFMSYELGIRLVTLVKRDDSDFKFSHFRINIFKIANEYRKIKKRKNEGKVRVFYAFFITFYFFILFLILAIISFFL